jgi:predicted permease
VLLIVAGLLVRALQHTLRTSPGFGYERVLAIDPGLADHGYSPESARACLAQFESRVRALPGVIAVAEAKLAPLGRTVSRMSVQIDGHPVDIYPNWVSPDFFGTMEIPVLAGRTLSSGEKNAVVVSESLARRQWPAKNPLGQKFWDRDTVVGVVGNARMNALNDGDTVEAYWAAQTADMPALTLVVKTAGAPDRFPAAVKAIAEALDPRLVPEMRLLKASFDEQMHGYQEAVVITSLMGIAAVLLAALGLLGLVSHAVSERAKEIAIRMALGARPSHVLTAIVSQFLWPIAGGVSVGLAGTAALSGVLRKALFGVSNLDPLSYVGAITMLVAIAGCAAVLPARRALRLQPMRALHHD